MPQSRTLLVLFLLLREPDFRLADRTDGNDLQPGRFSHVPLSPPGSPLNEASYVNRQLSDGLLTGQTLFSSAGHPAETIHPLSLKLLREGKTELRREAGPGPFIRLRMEVERASENLLMLYTQEMYD